MTLALAVTLTALWESAKKQPGLFAFTVLVRFPLLATLYGASWSLAKASEGFTWLFSVADSKLPGVFRPE